MFSTSLRMVFSHTLNSCLELVQRFATQGVIGFSLALHFGLIAFCPGAAASQSATAGLTDLALKNVLADIARMRKVNEQNVGLVHLEAAKLNELEDFYNSAELTKQSRAVRENGLILAGAESQLFKLDKPSDISRKMAFWFADEMRSARSNQRLSQSEIRLWGPYENFSDDAAVFGLLWSCLPRQVWLAPELNPYRLDLNLRGLGLLPVNARNSEQSEQDFAYCMELRIGYRLAQTDTEELANLNKNQLIARRLRALLPQYLAKFLHTQACSGQGPDDCVVLLATWASLEPGSAALAQMLQKLEPELPATFTQKNVVKPAQPDHRYDFADGNQYFDQLLRQLVFLKVKWHAQRQNPQIWPAQGATQTLKQIFSLMKEFEHPYVSQFSGYQQALKQVITPTDLLHTGADNTEKLELLVWLDQQKNCQALQLVLPLDEQNQKVFKQFLWQVLGHKRLPNCSNWGYDYQRAIKLIEQSLIAEDSDRQKLQQILPELPGNIRYRLLELLHIESCFYDRNKDLPNWRRTLCKQWATEPATINHPRRLQHSGLTLRKKDKFHFQSLYQTSVNINFEDKNWALNWLKSLAVFKAAGYAEDLLIVADYLQKHVSDINSVGLYTHPNSPVRLLLITGQLRFEVNEYDWQHNNDRQLLIELRKQSARVVTIPSIYTFQNDDGGISGVSDIDGDDNLELWFKGIEGECESEGLQPGESPKPGVDCSFPVYKVGEISDNTVSWFKKSLAISGQGKTQLRHLPGKK